MLGPEMVGSNLLVQGVGLHLRRALGKAHAWDLGYGPRPGPWPCSWDLPKARVTAFTLESGGAYSRSAPASAIRVRPVPSTAESAKPSKSARTQLVSFSLLAATPPRDGDIWRKRLPLGTLDSPDHGQLCLQKKRTRLCASDPTPSNQNDEPPTAERNDGSQGRDARAPLRPRPGFRRQAPRHPQRQGGPRSGPRDLPGKQSPARCPAGAGTGRAP